MRRSLGVEIGRKSFCAVVFSIVKIDMGRSRPAGDAEIEPQRVNQCERVDRLRCDPVGGEIPRPRIQKPRNVRADGDPALFLLVPDFYSCVECSGIADQALAGKNLRPVAAYEIDTAVFERLLTLAGEDDRGRVQPRDLVAHLRIRRNRSCPVDLAHFCAG